jgi:hypothetical protein
MDGIIENYSRLQGAGLYSGVKAAKRIASLVAIE